MSCPECLQTPRVQPIITYISCHACFVSAMPQSPSTILCSKIHSLDCVLVQSHQSHAISHLWLIHSLELHTNFEMRFAVQKL
jgi:hypothetical protein